MHIFLEVYRTLSITRAAENLHMTQPAVTRAVQELERHYGVRLFERLNHRLFLTQSGRALYGYALHIEDAFDSLEKTLLNWDERGVLRVGASITLGNYALPALVKRFAQEKPGMRVQASVFNGARLEWMLLNNELDLALIEGMVRSPELTARPFAQDQLTLIVPPGHPLLAQPALALADLPAWPLLMREKGSAGRSFLDQTFAARGLLLRPLWESASTQALVRAVSLGLGVAILPEQLVREDIASGRVCTRPIDDAPLRRQCHLAYHRSKFLTPSAQRFLALCEEADQGETPARPQGQ